jgi:hypothetical protein
LAGRSTTPRQHLEGERLDDVVVGSAVEGVDLVGVAVLGGQHQDRGPDALRAKGAAHVVPVHHGQHDVEQDRVVGMLLGEPQALGAIGRHVDREAFGLQAGAQGSRQPHLVLHHEQPHHTSPDPRDPSCPVNLTAT